MKRQHVVDHLEKGRDYVLAEKHKTSDTYGKLAKYVPPGTWQAYEAYLGLPGKKSDLFLEPRHGCPKVSVASHLKRGAKRYLPGCAVSPNVNLIRKQYHTMLLRLSREDKCMALLSKVDAHSAAVAKKVYCTTTVRDDAKLGKLLFESLFGKPVAWPRKEVTQHTAATICDALQHLTFEDEPCTEEELHEEEFILWQESMLTNLGLQPLAGEVVPDEGTVVAAQEKKGGDVKDEHDAGEPPEKRYKGRPSLFSPQHQNWLIEKLREWGSVPPMGYIKSMIAEGQEKGDLPQVVDGNEIGPEQVRQFMRTYWGNHMN